MFSRNDKTLINLIKTTFQQSGLTLVVQLPEYNFHLITILEELDTELASIGGKIY